MQGKRTLALSLLLAPTGLMAGCGVQIQEESSPEPSIEDLEQLDGNGDELAAAPAPSATEDYVSASEDIAEDNDEIDFMRDLIGVWENEEGQQIAFTSDPDLIFLGGGSVPEPCRMLCSIDEPVGEVIAETSGLAIPCEFETKSDVMFDFDETTMYMILGFELYGGQFAKISNNLDDFSQDIISLNLGENYSHNDISIEIDSVEFCDRVGDSGSDSYFYEAGDDTSLITKGTIANSSSESISLGETLIGSGVNSLIVLNGGEDQEDYKNAFFWTSGNNWTAIRPEVESGETAELAIICPIEKNHADEIESAVLYLSLAKGVEDSPLFTADLL